MTTSNNLPNYNSYPGNGSGGVTSNDAMFKTM